MTMNVLGYAAPSAKVQLESYRFERRNMRADDVVIEILYCGICHPEIHMVSNDWGGSIFHLIPEYEIIGRVVNIGAKSLK